MPKLMKQALERQTETPIEELLKNAFPLSGVYDAPIMLENHPNDSRIKIDDSGNCQTLTSRMGTGGGNVPLCMMPIATEDISYIVRRLTPRECAKLQGFPADWHEGITNAKGKTLPDSAAYKGYGNAVATVCAAYPIANIIKKLKEENSHGQEEHY